MTDATWSRLADQLRDAIGVEAETKRLYHATQRTQARAAKNLEDAQRAVQVAEHEIRKFVAGGGA
ncbi:hypothetical protein [Rhodococcus erythropolis]|uniref:hypothetical protein n=1 Tax=Rhodococcus erythropolis TaxID=1833 RepID=UPI0012D3B476|nr:hypothetical protein [Rhodococcus erythropolis]